MFSFCNTPKQHFKLSCLCLYITLEVVLAMFVFIISSEEVFDFSSGQMTQAKAKHLKDRLESMEIEFTNKCHFNNFYSIIVESLDHTLILVVYWK